MENLKLKYAIQLNMSWELEIVGFNYGKDRLENQREKATDVMK